MKFKNTKNPRIYLPLMSSVLLFLLTPAGYLFSQRKQMDTKEYSIFFVLCLLVILSLWIMKHRKYSVGLTIYLSINTLVNPYLLFFKIETFSVGILVSIYLLINVIFFLEGVWKYILLTIALTFSSLYIFTNQILNIEIKFISNILLLISIVFLVDIKRWMYQLYAEKIKHDEKIQFSIFKILGKVSELKDIETTHHLERVMFIMEILAKGMRKNPRFSKYISDEYIEYLKYSAFLHDIGKMGIPEYILNKPGPLTEEELKIVQDHTLIGYQLIQSIKKDIQTRSFFDISLPLVRHHHERWDGTGYPDSLKGEEIPLSARMMAIVDVYDALISTRSYKKEIPHQEAMKIIKNNAGVAFDPVITQIFLNESEKIHKKILSLGNISADQTTIQSTVIKSFPSIDNGNSGTPQTRREIRWRRETARNVHRRNDPDQSRVSW